ncbi:MAG: fibronectin type III domain-containing protein [Paludibacteraceae bacterium]|nr:fibronectin type III domain-containing protein [Paludibacteraceae bacterium]
MKRILFLLTACTVALCASAANHYVSQATGDDNKDGLSWANAMQTIAKGFSACGDGDTLFIAAGTYNERVTIKAGSFVSMMGGYNSAGDTRDPEVFKTIMDGSNLGKILIKAEAEPTVPVLIDGLIMEHAEYSSSGSAIYMRGNMTVNNCIMRDCHSQSAGGAIYVDVADKTLPTVISNCLIELCTANSSGGAIHNTGAVIENCIIRGCEGVYASVVLRGGSMRNCVLYNNSAGDSWPNSGGVYNPAGEVINCTFTNNYGAKYAGIHSDNYVFNSVMWGNKAEEGFTDPVNYIAGAPSSHNIADQGFNSEPFLSLTLNADNSAADGPHFVAPTNFVGVPANAAQIAIMQAADWSIEAGSFLIDKGLADKAPATDLNGVARPKGEGVDVGAYEYDPNAPVIPLQGFNIYQDSVFIHAESMEGLSVLFTPRNATNRTLNWTSDNPAIATVDAHGTVTGVSEGITIIRATSVDGGFTDAVVAVITPKPPVLYPVEVLEADEQYKIEDYTIPSFIPFWVAKEAARIDSFAATEEMIATIDEKLEAMYAAAAQLVSKEEPYNMVANFNGNPRTNMAFAWFTNEGITEGKVQIVAKAYATAADFEGENVLTLEAEATTTVPLRYAVATSGLLKATHMPTKTAFRYVSHKAMATNLMPGTAYSWRVGYDGHWSKIAHFRTQNSAQGEYSFLYMSDSHIQDAEYVENAKWCATAAANTVPEARFCLFPGDFVETGTDANSEWEWERWFEESIRPVIMKMPMVVTDGNHDDSPLLNYDYHFNTNTEFWSAAQTKPQFHGITYSFVYGDVLFLVYSLQDWWRADGSSDLSLKSTYLSTDVKNWFKEQIALHPNTKYRVTLSHKNIFSGSGHSIDKEIPLFREIMLPILKECEIDLAIQGHDHCYEVIGPVNPDTRTVVEGAVTDTVHVAVNTNTNMTGIEGGTYCTDDGTLYFIGATCGRKRYYPYSREKMEDKYSTDPETLFDGNHHNVENYFDLFTGMFGQPGAPSFTKFTVKNDGIHVNSYTANTNGTADLINTMKIVRTKEHTPIILGLDNVETQMQEGQKFIRNGQIFILKNGVIYDMMGQVVK